jgi:hypothetical protein
MKYLKFLKAIAVLVIAVSVFVACKKVKRVDPIGDGGQTVVKIINGGPAQYTVGSEAGDDNDGPGSPLYGVDFVTTPQVVFIVSVRRDVPNNAELNKAATVILQEDTSMIWRYNDTAISRGNGTVDTLPTNVFSISPAKEGGYNGTYKLEFAPGELAKEVKLTINNPFQDLDPNITYALAFKIGTVNVVGGAATIGWSSGIVVRVGAKNKYDGVYKLNGIHNRPGYQFFYEAEMQMITTGASSVIYYWPDVGSVGHPIATDANNTLSWYGTAVAPQVDFDPVTNLVTDIYNTTPSPPISMNDGNNYPNPPDPAHPTISRYDEATKTMYLYWKYNNNTARGFFDTLVFIKPR